jgi:hypothetical protein
MPVTVLCTGGEILRSKEHSMASVYLSIIIQKFPRVQQIRRFLPEDGSRGGF